MANDGQVFVRKYAKDPRRLSSADEARLERDERMQRTDRKYNSEIARIMKYKGQYRFAGYGSGRRLGAGRWRRHEDGTWERVD